ncbi:MAG: hypothetical protein D6731_14275 [Planctomycetota bacterium]|nr:MAG: hypothetical protein D6731_14275 [Planctomycetota bacterium]
MQFSKQRLTSAAFHFAGAATLVALFGCAAPDPAPEPAFEEASPADTADAPAQPGPAAEAPSGPPDEPPPGGGGGGGVLDELAKELSLRDQERQALARHYFETGKRYYDTFDYRKAAENFAKAQEALPNDPTIRHYLLLAQLLAGDRQAEFKTVAEELRRQKEVSIQQEKADLERIYAEGERLFEAKEFDKAIVRFEQVLEKIRWFPYRIDDKGYEDNARAYIVRARRLKRDLELAQAEERERRALQQAEEEQKRYLAERRAAVNTLLKKALDQIVLHQFKAAEETLREVRLKDPDNEEAHKLAELAREGRHTSKEDEIYEENLLQSRHDQANNEHTAVPYLPEGGVTFPDRETWIKRVRARTEGISQEEQREPDWVREYRQILASRPITLNFPDTPFAEVVGFLQDITGLNITVASSVDTEETTVSLRLTDVLLEDALKIILEQTGLAMTFKDQTLLITQPEEARGEYVLEIYDVQDLLSAIPNFPGDTIRVAGDSSGGGGGGGAGGSFTFEENEEEEGTVLDAEQLETIITNSVGEDNWDDPASIEIHRGQIIINQTREIHKEIRRVLQNMRRNTGLFVQVETRFIRMTDDFLRDIGVDLRGLGNSVAPNIATPVFGQPQLLDPNIPTSLQGGNIDIGFGRQIPAGGAARISRLGLPGNVGPGGIPFFGSNMLGGRTQHILQGGDAYFAGERLNGTQVSGANIPKGMALQVSVLDPIQINAIVRAEEETGRRKIVDAPVITAANRQRVSISVITQRAYISDYELSSGGTGNVVAEVADPIIETFQEGIVLDVRPTISADRKYITLDVKPTLATLVGGNFRQIAVNLGTISNAAVNVNIEVPEVTLQEAFTSVTLPDGGTALLGGFRKINEKEEHSGVPFIDHIPLLNKLFGRDAQLYETFSLLIMITAKTINLREQERKLFNLDEED